ncbi:MAG TPA: hypothetical protein VFH39_01520 [Candidatus Saccharimonadales bacterium]|nr:hypothetical protein [Candidatus Saccharimonadales bacterium]
MQPKTKRKSKRLGALKVIGFWVVLGLVLTYNRQGIIDAWRLHTYQPTPAVAAIARDDTMTPKARNIFYVNEPVITAKTAFSNQCPSGTERTVVLGCYHSNQNGIFVLKVTDNRLNGVEQVTAAHEMLHAAYDRLSGSQKHTIDAELQAFYANGLTDQVVKQQIADYQKSEPNDVTNEMHSLFATEVTKLPTDLETYYGRYFTDRQAVIKLYDGYEAEFTGRQATIQADDTKLAAMRQQITTMEPALQQQAADLDTQRAQLEAKRQSGDVRGYNAAVPGYNASVNEYNAKADTLRSLIAAYNRLVAERNAVAAETNQLTAEISNSVPSIQQ